MDAAETAQLSAQGFLSYIDCDAVSVSVMTEG